MKSSVYLLVLLLLTTFSSVFAQHTYHLLNESTFEESVLSSGVLNNYKTFAINLDELKRLHSDAPQELSLSIPDVNGGTFSIAMQKKNVFFDGFNVKTPSGTVNNLDFGVHYSGKLTTAPNSLVAFSFYKHCLFGMIATDAGNFNLIFLRDEQKNPSQRYVLYNDRDLTIANTFSCATDELPKIPRQLQNNEKAGGELCQTITQYLECDYEMYLDNGSDIQNTMSWTAGMFNVMSSIYSVEQIHMEISEIFVWDTLDPYPFNTSNVALEEFGHTRQDNFNGDLAHLYSTRNEGNGGIAWLDILCQSYSSGNDYGRFAYSNIDDAYNNLPLWSWSINVITHETGHNLGSPHTHWCGWELSPGVFGAIDYCYQTEPADEGQCYNGPVVGITGTIMSYCHLSGNVNFNFAFGPLPGNAIRNRVNNSNCISSTAGPGKPEITGITQYCTGENMALNATIPSGSTITWTGPAGFSSTQNSIAVNNLIVANSGQYVATVSNGNCSISEFAFVQVTSKPAMPYITRNGNTLRCLPGATSYAYQWYTSDGTPVGTGQYFSPQESGQYYVIITRNGCSSESSNIFDFTYLMSIDGSKATEENIQIWPNPANDIIHITYNNPDYSNYLLTVVDMSGRIISQQQMASDQNILDVQHFSNGMYIMQINTGNKLIKQKFLVQH